jgi:DNA-binding response OmpR family regulator
VLAAPDRAKALALLSTLHPDLIMVDINGQTLELVDTVRSGDGIAGAADPDIPMIVMSRDADRLRRIRLLESGGDDVVKKPLACPVAPRADRGAAAPVAHERAGQASAACRPAHHRCP